MESNKNILTLFELILSDQDLNCTEDYSELLESCFKNGLSPNDTIKNITITEYLIKKIIKGTTYSDFNYMIKICFQYGAKMSNKIISYILNEQDSCGGYYKGLICSEILDIFSSYHFPAFENINWKLYRPLTQTEYEILELGRIPNVDIYPFLKDSIYWIREQYYPKNFHTLFPNLHFKYYFYCALLNNNNLLNYLDERKLCNQELLDFNIEEVHKNALYKLYYDITHKLEYLSKYIKVDLLMINGCDEFIVKNMVNLLWRINKYECNVFEEAFKNINPNEKIISDYQFTKFDEIKIFPSLYSKKGEIEEQRRIEKEEYDETLFEVLIYSLSHRRFREEYGKYDSGKIIKIAIKYGAKVTPKITQLLINNEELPKQEPEDKYNYIKFFVHLMNQFPKNSLDIETLKNIQWNKYLPLTSNEFEDQSDDEYFVYAASLLNNKILLHQLIDSKLYTPLIMDFHSLKDSILDEIPENQVIIVYNYNPLGYMKKDYSSKIIEFRAYISHESNKRIMEFELTVHNPLIRKYLIGSIDPSIEDLRKYLAIRKIQRLTRNWLELPMYKSGHMGYHCRKNWEELQTKL